MQAYEELRWAVEGVAGDVAKAEAGNRAAGTRARKAMQEVKRHAQAVRKATLAATNSAAEANRAAGE